jgi:hypothetical protein
MRWVFAHFSLAPCASIGDNPALSQKGGAGARDVGLAAVGATGAR